MLTEIRQGSSGWFAYVIAALIIIPMAFWGVQEYASTDASLSIVEIGEQKISQNAFQQKLSSEQQRMRQRMGEQVNNDLLNSDGFKQQVLQQMINRALIQHVADEHDYRFSDKQLADVIKQSELFQTEDGFDQSAYDRYLAGSVYSKNRYEEELRAGQRLNQVMSGYQESALVLSDEVRYLLELQAEQRTFEMLTVKRADFVKDAVPVEMDIADYYSNNKQQFMQDEKASVSYLELSLDDLLDDIKIDEQELRAIYEQSAESFVSDEKRQTRHILLSTSDGEGEDAQQAKAEKLVSELRAGGDFAELAKTNSEDPGSANNGGSLGLVERGQMVPQFEQAAFSLAEGEISDPVKSPFGYHIIQVEKIQASQQQPFAEVKFDLEQDERQRIAEETLLERVEELRDLAYEQPDNLDAASEALELPILETTLFDRSSGTGIASNAVFRDTAFSEEILVDEINSEPIEIGAGKYVVMRKLDHQDSKPKMISEVYQEIKTLLTNQNATQAAELTGVELLEQAQQDWAVLSQRDDLKIESHTISLADSEPKVGPQIIELITSMHMLDGTVEVESLTDRAGDFHILRLNKVMPGDLNSLSEQVKEGTRRLVAQRNGESLVSTYLEGLREQLAPAINTELL